MLPRMRRSFALLLVPALTVGLVACSDDDDDASGDDETTLTTGALGAPDSEGEFDPDAVTEQLEDAIVGEDVDTSWHVVGVAGNEIVISPNEGVEVTEDEANTVCGAVATIALNALPTAVVTVTDSDGAPLITSEGPEGCHPAGEEE